MFHATRCNLAVAVTVNPAAEAVRVIGPATWSPPAEDHIHTGMPTRPTRPGRSSGTMPIVTGRSCIAAIARSASTRGSGPAGVASDQKSSARVTPGVMHWKTVPLVRPPQIGSDFGGAGEVGLT